MFTQITQDERESVVYASLLFVVSMQNSLSYISKYVRLFHKYSIKQYIINVSVSVCCNYYVVSLMYIIIHMCNFLNTCYFKELRTHSFDLSYSCAVRSTKICTSGAFCCC